MAADKRSLSREAAALRPARWLDAHKRSFGRPDSQFVELQLPARLVSGWMVGLLAACMWPQVC